METHEAESVASPSAASGPSTALTPAETLVSDLASPGSNPVVALLPPEVQNDFAAAKPTEQPSDPKPTPDEIAEESGIAHNTAADKYLQLMDRLRTHWTDRPDVLIQYRDIHYTVRVPIVDVTTRSFIQAGANGLVRLVKKLDLTGYLRRHDRQIELHALASCSGRIAPGSMTLILAPPGHGKSTLLRALAGRLVNDPHFGGEVLYNGQTAQQVTKKGVRMRKLLSYVGQSDIHFPVLTVRETLTFAAQNANASVAEFNDPQLDAMEAERPDRLIHMVGLEEAANTVIGNDLLRGVSGGQKKRVTIGELLITNARVHLLDEVSTGLDSAITFHIFNALRSICGHQRTSVVTALLQPTPETFGLFDEVILLREGEVVFHGKRERMRPYFRDVLNFPIPDDEDEAGFVVDYLTNPTILQAGQRKKQLRRAQRSSAEGYVSQSRTDYADDSKQSYSVSVVNGTKQPLEPPALETAVMVDRWRRSSDFVDLIAESSVALEVNQSDPKNALEPASWIPFTKKQFAADYPHSAFQHMRLCLHRQRLLTVRNKQVFMPRFFQAVLVGVIFGTLFYQLDPSDYNSRFGVTLYVCMYTAFSNLSELPVASEARAVVTKQLDASFFPSLPYVFSVIFMGIPIIVIEIIIFSLWMYWMTGFAAEAGRFFFFVFTLLSSSLALSTFFRSISYVTPNPDVARQLDLPFIIIFVIFGGFLIPYSEVPHWLVWVFWISPLSWSFRSIALNEYKSSQFDALVNNGGSMEREGDFDMQQFDVNTNEQYKWAGIGYLLGFFLIFAVISSFAIQYIRAGVTLGTKRVVTADSQHVRDSVALSTPPASVPTEVKVVAAPPETPTDQQTYGAEKQLETNGVEMQTAQGTQVSAGLAKQPSQYSKSFQMAGLPFTPVSLAWRDINYFVTIVSGKGKAKTKVEKQLLKGINGFSQPGTLTALMGSSGAGKTTLMDVIAGRKTVGRITGDILVNGRPKQTKSFNRLTGYVEQQDLHMGHHTVREALDFSAHIRLPASIAKAQRDAWVVEVMALVGLTNIADRLIGDAATPGLAPGQMKLVTIAVELVANPSVLFLDEPTSGLDAPSAFRIMTAVKRIANTGRSVLCTIHQPSSELFFMFDRLLLLRSGGEEVFFSDIGPQGKLLVNYFEHRSEHVVKHPPRLPTGQNPANWMLDVIGAGVHSDEGGAIAALDYEAADWHQLWKTSELQKQVYAELDEVSKPENAGVDAAQIAIEQPYPGWFTRYALVQERYFVMHWRNAPVNLSRCILMLAVGILFGLIYRDVDKTTYAGVQAFLAVIFLGLGFPAAIASASALPSLFRQRAVYYRESTINMYDYWTYSTAIAVVEAPYIFFTLIFFLVPFYFLVGFAHSGTLFFKYYLVLFLQSLVFSFMSHIWLALMPSQISSNIINGLFLSLFFVFGGVFIKPASIRTGWKWYDTTRPHTLTHHTASDTCSSLTARLCTLLLHALIGSTTSTRWPSRS